MTEENDQYIAEFKEAEKEVIAYYESPGIDCNPFKQRLFVNDNPVKTSIPQKAAAEIFEMLHKIHACYNYFDDGEVKSQIEAEVVISHMHELLDETIALVKYSTYEPGEWENEHDKGLPTPEWLIEVREQHNNKS